MQNICMFVCFCLPCQYLQTFSRPPFTCLLKSVPGTTTRTTIKVLRFFVYTPAWFTCMLGARALKEKLSKGEAGWVVLLFSHAGRRAAAWTLLWLFVYVLCGVWLENRHPVLVLSWDFMKCNVFSKSWWLL